MKTECKNERDACLDAIRGCIFGGAVGDALGYPIEFYREENIFSVYGPQGITEYRKDFDTGKALISDDTQMTLFTANGLLVGDTRDCMCGNHEAPRFYVANAYQDWLKTQYFTIDEVNRHERNTPLGGTSWLLDVPELYSRRSPGNTCLDALKREKNGERYKDYVMEKRNRSKGCGGIMRIAPLALRYPVDIEELDMEGAQVAAITHGHSLGYMPAAVQIHILNRIIFPPEGKRIPLKEIITEARDTAAKLFAGDEYLPELISRIDQAVMLAEDDFEDDLDNIHQIGEGGVAEQTLGIALYCAMRYENDFSGGVIAAVNHNGDSDSTGAVAGNILGALTGYNAIEEKWKKDLELSDVILEIADDLCYGCPINGNDSEEYPEWERKYYDMHRVI